MDEVFPLQKLGARKSWNDALDSSRGNRRKGMEREQAFLQLGQVRNWEASFFAIFLLFEIKSSFKTV